MIRKGMIYFTVLTLALCFSVGSWAAGDRSRLQDGSCATLDKTPFVYTGEVVTVGPLGQGLEIALPEGNEYFFSLGPDWYWETLEVDKPTVGETVTVEGYTVTLNGEERNLLTAITIDDILVPLRGDDGRPLWRNSGARNGGGRS